MKTARKTLKKPSVIIIGAGGHARVLIDTLRARGVKIVGVTDKSRRMSMEGLSGIRFLGNDSSILKYSPKKVRLVNGLGSVKASVARKQIYDLFKNKGYLFLTVAHPSAVIAKDVELGEGAQVMAGAVIQTGSRIGENTIINTRASVDHDCVLGPHVHLAPGAVLSGGVKIGEGSHIGTGAVVIQGVSIAKGSFVRAASLVKENLRNINT